MSPPAPSPLLGLAPGGVCLAARAAGELLPHLFTLARTGIPDLVSRPLAVCFCGTFRGSPRLGVTQHRALRSSDFPRRLFWRSRRDRPAHL